MNHGQNVIPHGNDVTNQQLWMCSVTMGKA